MTSNVVKVILNIFAILPIIFSVHTIMSPMVRNKGSAALISGARRFILKGHHKESVMPCIVVKKSINDVNDLNRPQTFQVSV